jgi:hypothetical protein
MITGVVNTSQLWNQGYDDSFFLFFIDVPVILVGTGHAIHGEMIDGEISK